jgi:hypothetical protein
MLNTRCCLGLLILLALLVGPPAANSADWQKVGENDNFTSFVDVDTLLRSGDVVKAWVKAVFKAPQPMPDGNSFQASRELQYFRCTERQWAIKSIRFFKSTTFDDNVVLRDDVDEVELKWRDIAPGTVAEGMMEFTCARAPKH